MNRPIKVRLFRRPHERVVMCEERVLCVAGRILITRERKDDKRSKNMVSLDVPSHEGKKAVGRVPGWVGRGVYRDGNQSFLLSTRC